MFNGNIIFLDEYKNVLLLSFGVSKLFDVF